MKKYSCVVTLCEGYSCGTISIYAGNGDKACEKVMNYVCDKLAEALPELDIPVSVELEDKYYE